MRHTLPFALAASLIAGCSSSPQSGSESLQLGSQGDDGEFRTGLIALSAPFLIEGGTTSFTLQMVDGRGAPVRPKSAASPDQPVAKVDPRPPPVDIDIGDIIVSASSACISTGKATVDIPQFPSADGTIPGAYTDLGCDTDDVLTIRATFSRSGQTLTATADIPSLRFGTFDGDLFVPGLAQLLSAPIASGESTTLRIVQRSASGGPLAIPAGAPPTAVTFESPCIAAGLARFEGLPDFPGSGAYTGTYTDFGCSLADTLLLKLTRPEGEAIVEQKIPVVRLGSRATAGPFAANELLIQVPDVSPLGTTTFTATISDAAGNPFVFDQGFTASQFIFTATSPCQLQGLAQIQVATPSAAGTINGTYTNAGCTDPDVVTVRAVLPSSGAVLTASGTVVVSRAANSISYSGPENLSLRLQGLTEGQTVSVPFTVSNANGDPIPNQRVDFTLSTLVGGLSLASSSVTTNSMGVASAVVNSGRIPVNFSVTARTQTPTGQSLTTQSRPIIVFSDIPSQSGMSVSLGCSAIEGFAIDGVEAPIVLRIADRYGNFFVPGTQPNAIASGGAINGGCVVSPIGSPSNVSPSDSSCSFTFRTQGVRPQNGIAYVMAYLDGEETFVDSNGNGLYDEGEPFTDRGNAFLDANGNGARDDNEIFIDRLATGAYSPGNEMFDGYVCTAGNCRFTGADVFVNAPIILSGPAAPIPPPNPSLGAVQVGSAGTYQINGGDIGRLTFRITDARGNQVPPESTVALVVTNGTHISEISAAGRPSSEDEIIVGCPGNGRDNSTFSFDLSAALLPTGLPVGATNASTVTLIVTTPSGVETLASFTVRSQPTPTAETAP